MGLSNSETCTEAWGYTKELGVANRRFGALIYKATTGTVTDEERVELDRLALETPEMLKKASNG